MGLLPTKLNFGDTPLSIIDRHGEPWVTAADLGRALGYGRGQGGRKLTPPLRPRLQSTFAVFTTATPTSSPGK